MRHSPLYRLLTLGKIKHFLTYLQLYGINFSFACLACNMGIQCKTCTQQHLSLLQMRRSFICVELICLTMHHGLDNAWLVVNFSLHCNHVMDLDKHTCKQASKKTNFTVDLIWWGSLRLTPITIAIAIAELATRLHF